MTAQEKLTESQRVFHDAEHRLHGLLAQPVTGLIGSTSKPKRTSGFTWRPVLKKQGMTLHLSCTRWVS